MGRRRRTPPPSARQRPLSREPPLATRFPPVSRLCSGMRRALRFPTLSPRSPTSTPSGTLRTPSRRSIAMLRDSPQNERRRCAGRLSRGSLSNSGPRFRWSATRWAVRITTTSATSWSSSRRPCARCAAVRRGSTRSTARHPATGTTTTATRALRQHGRRCAARSSKRSSSPAPAISRRSTTCGPSGRRRRCVPRRCTSTSPTRCSRSIPQPTWRTSSQCSAGPSGNVARSRPIAPCCN